MFEMAKAAKVTSHAWIYQIEASEFTKKNFQNNEENTWKHLKITNLKNWILENILLWGVSVEDPVDQKKQKNKL